MPLPAGFGLSYAQAATKSKNSISPVKRPNAGPSDNPRYAALVVNAGTGQILMDKYGTQKRHPASLTKMMTLYILFDELRRGKMTMKTMLPVSAKAASAPPTNIYLTSGDRIPVELAIKALIIRSANDVAMVVAEGIGGSQSGFAKMMNDKAKALGMDATKFYNPSGLPDDRQVTSAYDMARLGIALQRDFPEYYHYFNDKQFDWRNRTFKGHNRLLGRYPGADGIKTGYINASGFNLVSSAQRGNNRLVAVVMGGRTAASRDQHMIDILDEIFTKLARGRRAANDNTLQGKNS